MIQPFCSNLFSGTFFHRFLRIVTWNIRKQSVHPDTYFIFVLLFKLSLAVNSPAHEPFGILTAYNTTGNYLAASWITLTNIGDIRQYFLIQCGNGCGFPICLGNIRTEFFRTAKCRILFRNIFPKRPAATGTYQCISIWRMMMVPVNRTLCAASIGDKNKIFFCQQDSFFYTFDLAFNSGSYFLAVFYFKCNIGYFCVKLEVNACCLQIFLHRQNQGFILIISGKLQGTEIRQSGNMVDKPLEIQLHFQGAVPVFKSKHGSPVKPEGRIKNFLIKDIFNGFIV